MNKDDKTFLAEKLADHHKQLFVLNAVVSIILDKHPEIKEEIKALGFDVKPKI